MFLLAAERMGVRGDAEEAVRAAVASAPYLRSLAAFAAQQGHSGVGEMARPAPGPVRRVRRHVRAVCGEVVYADGSREPLDAATLIAAPESALRILWLALVLLGFGALLARYL